MSLYSKGKKAGGCTFEITVTPLDNPNIHPEVLTPDTGGKLNIRCKRAYFK